MKSFKILKNILIWLVIMILFAGTFHSISHLLRFKELSNVWEVFRHEKRNSYDVIFLGSSHQFCSIDVNLLYEEYGINGFMLATPGQSVPMSYYAAKEAIEKQHPKTIVLETLYFSQNPDKLSAGMLHSFFDGMPLNINKIQAVHNLIPKQERGYYLFDIGYYNVRRKNLSKFDFECPINSKRGAYERQENVFPLEEFVLPERNETLEIDREAKDYLDKLIILCEKNNVQLVLYASPHTAVFPEDTPEDVLNDIRMYNWLEEYLTGKQIPFYNTFYETEEIGILPAEHFMDSHHLNANGQEIFTRFMALNSRIPQ